jgi:hypothetical protein
MCFQEHQNKGNNMSLMKDFALLQDLPLFRDADPDTSRQGAADVRPRQGSQAMQLLTEYAHARIGLTDEEAGQRSGLAQRGAGYWKRCSDLRRLGFIEDSHTTRPGSSGSEMMVCIITVKGLEAYRA